MLPRVPIEPGVRLQLVELVAVALQEPKVAADVRSGSQSWRQSPSPGQTRLIDWGDCDPGGLPCGTQAEVQDLPEDVLRYVRRVAVDDDVVRVRAHAGDARSEAATD